MRYMSRKTVRAVLAVLVLLATITIFTVYLLHHPEIFRTLSRISPVALAAIFLLYIFAIGSLVWIQRAVLGLTGIELEKKENALVVMYSTIINFFGPLQSGPAFRAAYLKTRHHINLKKYALATLVYYGLFALFSGLFLLAYLIGLWIFVLAAAAFAAAPLMLKIKYFRGLDLPNVRQLALATFCQVAVQSIIFFAELRILMPQVTYVQTLVYTGAANFAMFVSLTPGAIGFREAFLLFSQKIHHIGTDTIAAASLIDRSVYIVFLLIMAAVIFGMHANDYLKTKQVRKEAKAAELK